MDLQKLKNRYGIVGSDEALNRALETAVTVSGSDLTVLITGESGAGKEVIPQIIHQNSPRRTGKYLAVNCGAIPEGTINAELFGHEKGAFTGAVAERKGYFEEADGGTLFLDEVGELPKSTQALLLRVLQSGEYIKVGSSKVEKTDVRVICATNVDLSYAVATGKFRADLYYRLNAIEIRMPALRERKEDIYLLFRKFSSDFAEKYHLCKLNLSHDATTALTSYRWPGNVRQLKNVAEAVTAMVSVPVTPSSERIEIGAEAILRHLPKEEDTLLPATAVRPSAEGAMNEGDRQMFIKALLDLKNEVDTLKRIVSEGGVGVAKDTPAKISGYQMEEPEEQMAEEPADNTPEDFTTIRRANDTLIEKCLAKHGGKVREAAAELGISERTIYRKLAEKKKK